MLSNVSVQDTKPLARVEGTDATTTAVDDSPPRDDTPVKAFESAPRDASSSPATAATAAAEDEAAADMELVTSQLSSNLRQRLSRGVHYHNHQQHQRTSSGNTGNTSRDEDALIDVAPDSTSSATTSLQWRRNNPYATSPAKSLQLDDTASPFFKTMVSPATPGGPMHSPPQVTVVCHANSTRVSRTTSIVKAGDATRISRTTSMKTGENSVLYSPQLPQSTSSLPGSERVSRQTSMVKGNESIVFPMQNLRFAISQPSSTRVSRTTSMVKSGNPNNDSTSMFSPLLQHPQQAAHTPQQQQQQVPSMSPLLNVSPHSSQNNLLSPNAFLTGAECQPHSPSNQRVCSSTAEGSLTSTPAFAHNSPFRFSALACGAMMPPYTRAELFSSEPIDYDGENSNSYHNDTNGGVYEEETYRSNYHCISRSGVADHAQAVDSQRMCRPSFTCHYQQQQQQPQYSASGSQQKGCVGGGRLSMQLENNDDAAGAAVPIFTALSGYGHALVSPSAAAAASYDLSPHKHHYQSHYYHASGGAGGAEQPREEDDKDDEDEEEELAPSATAVFTESPALHSAPRRASVEDEKVQPHRQRSPPHFPPPLGVTGVVEETEDGEDNDAGSQQQQQQAGTEPAPNPLLSTQPPRSASTPQARDQDLPASACSASAAGGEAGSAAAFSASELTAALEAALQRGADNDDRGDNDKEVWCPAGSQFSVYDAGMREHYVIPSAKVALTRGAVKYATLFERYGNQTRFRFQLCNRYLHNRCTCGLECQYIHSHVVSESTHVHLNENSITAMGVKQMNAEELAGGRNTLGYKTMDCGMVFAVFPPNQLNSAPQLIPSEMILETEGAVQTYRALGGGADHASEKGGPSQTFTQPPYPVMADGSVAVPIVRPRHCAHFQFKRMCNLGAACHFIHSLIPFVQGVVNQPPLPYPLSPSSLDGRSAGFVLSKLPTGNVDGGVNVSFTMTAGGSNSSNDSAGMNTSAMAGPLSSTAPSQQQQQWTQPTTALCHTDPSMVPMGEVSAPMSAIFTPHYSHGITEKVPVAGSSTVTAYGANPSNAAYGAGWGHAAYAANCGHPYGMPTTGGPMGPMGHVGVPADGFPQPTPEQQQQSQGVLTSAFHPSAQLPPQAYATCSNPALQAPPQHAWPVMGNQYY
jgi:hypothetical protein